jgi:hypothetical protein
LWPPANTKIHDQRALVQFPSLETVKIHIYIHDVTAVTAKTAVVCDAMPCSLVFRKNYPASKKTDYSTLKTAATGKVRIKVLFTLEQATKAEVE